MLAHSLVMNLASCAQDFPSEWNQSSSSFTYSISLSFYVTLQSCHSQCKWTIHQFHFLVDLGRLGEIALMMKWQWQTWLSWIIEEKSISTVLEKYEDASQIVGLIMPNMYQMSALLFHTPLYLSQTQTAAFYYPEYARSLAMNEHHMVSRQKQPEGARRCIECPWCTVNGSDVLARLGLAWPEQGLTKSKPKP